MSSFATTVIAAVVGGVVAIVAAYGVVASQESAGNEITKTAVSYDG